MAREALRIDAPAKVNLVLRILGRRADGFHDIETLFQAVDLCDRLDVELTAEGDVALEVSGMDVGPTSENLAYRAARAVLDAAGSGRGVHLRLEKHIPAGGGLGGGSSDAAATLRVVNALLGDALTSEALADVAAGLGSDVPFFLARSTLAMGRGRGEVLESLPPLPEAYVALVMPPVHVSTGWAYGALAERRGEGAGTSGGDVGRESRTGVGSRAPAAWADVAPMAVNDFQDLVSEAHPEVARSLAELKGAGASSALLSGSGAACFGVFADEPTATAAVAALSGRLPWPVRLVRTLRSWPRPEPIGNAGGPRS